MAGQAEKSHTSIKTQTGPTSHTPSSDAAASLEQVLAAASAPPAADGDSPDQTDRARPELRPCNTPRQRAYSSSRHARGISYMLAFLMTCAQVRIAGRSGGCLTHAHLPEMQDWNMSRAGSVNSLNKPLNPPYFCFFFFCFLFFCFLVFASARKNPVPPPLKRAFLCMFSVSPFVSL